MPFSACHFEDPLLEVRHVASAGIVTGASKGPWETVCRTQRMRGGKHLKKSMRCVRHAHVGLLQTLRNKIIRLIVANNLNVFKKTDGFGRFPGREKRLGDSVGLDSLRHTSQKLLKLKADQESFKHKGHKIQIVILGNRM